MHSEFGAAQRMSMNLQKQILPFTNSGGPAPVGQPLPAIPTEVPDAPC